MTSYQKLKAMYGIKDNLHVLTKALITWFYESKKMLTPNDLQFIEDTYPLYFKTAKVLQPTRANLYRDPYESITYTKSRVKKAFPDVSLQHGNYYEFTYSSGSKVIFKCNSGRLYSGKLTGYDLPFVELGPNPEKVFHHVVSVKPHDKL